MGRTYIINKPLPVHFNSIQLMCLDLDFIEKFVEFD